MADVRSLLRQQRAARRIDHPQAAYSDAGRLLCTVCHEAIKAESLWDGHIRSAGHRDKLRAIQASRQANGRSDDVPQSHKRKHSDDNDEMGDDTEQEALRNKRSKPDMAGPAPALDVDMAVKSRKASGQDTERTTPKAQTPTLTPPFARRTSGTPVQGMEMKIPSRPATPNPMRDGTGSSSGGQVSASSTPKIAPLGRSPLIPQEATVATLPGPGTQPKPALPRSQQQIDEAEWAAFEAEVVNAPASSTAQVSAYAADAVISAAPMTADEVVARSEEEERAKRRAVADVQMEDEKEEATRALETEFEEMEELEARVRRLKEKREALRQQGGAGSAAITTRLVTLPSSKATTGKENAIVADDEDEDEDDEDEVDDWAGFRLRA